jgi:hypothetical protein
VLLTSGTLKVKVADFGLAKTNRQTVTRGIGTPAYMVDLLCKSTTIVLIY